MTDHDRLRQLAQAATPGPWESELEENPGIGDALVFTTLGFERVVAQEMSDADAEFIAAANPTTVLALLDEIRDAKAQALREAKAEINRYAVAAYAEGSNTEARGWVGARGILERMADKLDAQ